MVHPYSFPKSEHLCLKSTFDELFKSRKSIYGNGFKIVWMTNNEKSTTAQVAISVSKRNFKRAVHRNLLKRRIKEAYRLHKLPLIQLLEEILYLIFL